MSPQGAPRLRTFEYRGEYGYLLTVCTACRLDVLGDTAFSQWALTQFLQLAKKLDFAVLAYCLMPDHAHFLVIGTAPKADLRELIRRWKQITAFHWKRCHGATLWQRGYHDRILRRTENLLPVARYVLLNPVRAGLVAAVEDYPLSGSAKYPIDVILAADEWTPP